MSAFIVEKQTIDRVIAAMLLHYDPPVFAGYRLGSESARAALGQALWNMNIRAVDWRYEEQNPIPNYQYEPVEVSRVQASKSVSCLVYQCSEGPVVEDPLFKALAKFDGELEDSLSSADKPAWDRAEWG